MQLRRLTVENFRGFNAKHLIDLDARFLLFYGLNGPKPTKNLAELPDFDGVELCSVDQE